ncbi:hypothetical protein INS49_009418 [Diaporthe citri]|uniref:uncharacterized protein n=1 Tax=Diaporthe citri TaxID=83186 RepID=UPI001C7EF17D|nr:uncharacterized protein INS49_009418 [Diaporthe citri]KAG6361194.1 hypothetical protein INS49_009418 [Diaporthe citri]
MASPIQQVPSEAGVGAEAFENSTTTAPVTLPDDSDAAAQLIPELDDYGMTTSSSARLDNNGNDTTEACGDKKIPELDDRSRVLSKIKSLQDELLKIEKGARQEHSLEDLERQWDSELERVGGDTEERNWARIQGMKAQSFMKDTAAFAFGREWMHESEDSFIRYMMEREEFDKQLTQRRAQWEAKRGVTRPKIDESLQEGPRRPLTFPQIFDPLSPEARFNETDMAQGYDLKERHLRFQIHDVVRNRHTAFMSWKQGMQNLPEPPKERDPKLKDLWPRAVADYVQWESFRYGSPHTAFNSEEKQHLCALVVLDGEPDPKFLHPRLIYDLEKRAVQNNSKGLSRSVPRLAQGLVPEHVRLNGPQFTETFRVLDSPAFGVPFSRPQMALLQPYRLLIYHEQDIRDRYETLKDKFGTPRDHTAVLTGSSTQSPKQHDTEQDGNEQEVPLTPDAVVRASHKRDLGAEPGYKDRDSPQHEGQHEGKEGLQDEPENNTSEEKNEFPFANSKTALDYLGCLLEFMDSTISIRRKYVQGSQCRKVHFRDLWYLFSPGDEVIRRDGLQVYRVIGVTNPTHRESSRNVFFDYDEKDTSRYFQLSCSYVDFDGKRIGPVSTTFVIKTFAGERTVESLEVYPLRLHRHTSTVASQSRHHSSPPSGSETLREKLIKRGKKFFQAACMSLEHTFYDGPTVDGEEIESQVVVDFETALSSDKRFDKEDSVPQIKSLLGDTDDGDSTSASSEIVIPDCLGPCCAGQRVCNDSFVDVRRKEEYINSLIPKTYAKLPSVVIYPRPLDDTTGDNALTDDEFLVMSYRVFAFVLRTRKWEGIAEMFKKPLFTITCGDLGSTAREVEQALDLNFNLANRWGCILLLDEADVFLASRNETDFERNGLVAVFLRVLEYYAGILFLTTNRVGVIDEAFRSRIHISLYYPPLGYDETRAVFQLNLKLIEHRFKNEKRNIKIERNEILDYSLEYFRTNDKARWNGRQIRNACQTALALAEFKAQGGNHERVLDPNADVCLAVDNFKTVSKAYLEFTKYLKQLYGIHDDVRAKELGLRARETIRQPQAQSTHSAVFGGNITQPGSSYGHAQHYNSAPLNPMQTVHGQSYQPASMMGTVHMNPSIVTQQPGHQAAYYSNPAQVAPAGNFNTYGPSSQALSGQIPQQGQEFGGMQFQPAPGNINQQAQPWLVPASPPNSATMPPPPSVPAQQQFPSHAQQSPGTTHLGSQAPTSQPFQAQQSMPTQQTMQQQQQQQQVPQTWYPGMNLQGQNPPGPSPQERG